MKLADIELLDIKNLTARQIVDKLKEMFPHPKSGVVSAKDKPEWGFEVDENNKEVLTDNGESCVAGYAMFTGVLSKEGIGLSPLTSFPNADDVYNALLLSGLSYQDAEYISDKLISFNDEGKFDVAWSLLEYALTLIRSRYTL